MRSFLTSFIFILIMGCTFADDPNTDSILEDGEVSWIQALSLMESCKVTGIFQGHNLHVSFQLEDGSSVRFTEPSIDAIFAEFDRLKKCGDDEIIVATE
jgi:hypothetical protein